MQMPILIVNHTVKLNLYLIGVTNLMSGFPTNLLKSKSLPKALRNLVLKTVVLNELCFNMLKVQGFHAQGLQKHSFHKIQRFSETLFVQACVRLPLWMFVCVWLQVLAPLPPFTRRAASLPRACAQNICLCLLFM